MRALTASSRKQALRISAIARTRQSKALRWTVESAARRSIAVEAKSTCAANVIEYSTMRVRSVSTRKSGRICGQGPRSGCVGFLARLAHPTRQDRARQTAIRIDAVHRSARTRSPVPLVQFSTSV